MKNIKSKFPIFKNQPKLIYLDNAATTQICAPSLEAMNNYYLKFRANVHRGAYELTEKATAAYEGARTEMAKFINAETNEIIFTSGTTHGLNLLAHSLSPRFTHRDNIVLTRLEHHSNLVPWQVMAKHYGFEIRFIELTKDFQIDLISAKKLIDKNTKVVSFALVSNVLGAISPATELIELAKIAGATTIVDAAQAAAHFPIDVRKINCDWLVLSGHKMYGPSGIGILYGKNKLLEESVEPFFYGGEMVSEVSYDSAKWNEVPHRFEAGTPNIAGAIGLGAASNFLMEMGWKNIIQLEDELTEYAISKLIPLTSIFGPTQNRTGVISFSIPKIHPHDIGEMLNRDQVAIRVGFHCAEPLHRLYNKPGSARISLGIYNVKSDVDKAVSAIKKALKVFSV